MPDRKNKRNSVRLRIWSLIIVFLMVIGSIAVAFPPQERINQGLDIQGGLSVVLSAKTDDGQAPTTEEMEKSKSIIEQRVNALGASEATVQLQGSDQILVQIPGLSDSEQALDTIGKTGKLEFARLDSFTDDTTKSNIENGNIYDTSDVKEPYKDENGNAYSLTNYDKLKHITVDEGTYTPLFTGDHITRVTVDKASQTGSDYAVNVSLDSEAAKAFATATQELVDTKGKIVIIIDGEINSAPAVQAAITDGNVSITGGYTLDEAKSLQTVLESGSLPVSFQYEQAQTVGPTLGQGELEAGVMAMLIGLLVVIAYLIIFYRGFGTITAANMIIFACIYMGVLAVLSFAGVFSLSLAGIAGIILSIGMAADSSILVIERFKEEVKEGRSPKAASISGVKHAIKTSIDADVVSLISALALFIFASSSVKGFGLTLGLGILCDILVMLMFKAPIVRLLAPHVMRDHPGFWGIKYSLELGDVRAGTSNYLTPNEVKEALKERKERNKATREHDKEKEKENKEREKKANKKAREIRKESARREKEKAKHRDEVIKERQKREKEEFKRKKELAREAKKAEHADKHPTKHDVSDEYDTKENTTEDAKAAFTPEPEKEPEKHSESEIAKLVEEANKQNAPAPKRPTRKEERVVSDEYTLTGPSDENSYSAQNAHKGAMPPKLPNNNEVHMNRAQRRAAEKQARRKH